MSQKTWSATRSGRDPTSAPTPTPPVTSGAESPAVAAAEARAVAPLHVCDLAQIAHSRLRTVAPETLLVDVARLLSSAQISVAVVTDAAGIALGTITETVLVRRLGLGQADFFTTQASEVMTPGFASCAPDDLLSGVLATMHARGLIFMLLIVDAERAQAHGLDLRPAALDMGGVSAADFDAWLDVRRLVAPD